MSDRPAIKLEIEGPIATLTLDKPERHNALDLATFEELEAAIRRAAGDSTTRVMLITSSSPKAFSTGADLEQLAGLGSHAVERLAGIGLKVMDALVRAPVTTIAAVNGLALGGGWELALSCDLIYASQRATFAFPEVRLGLIPTFGGILRLEALVGSMRAREIVYTARTLRAETALELGAVLELLPPDQLVPYCRSVAERIARMSPVALAHAKQTMLLRPSPMQAWQADAETVFAGLLRMYGFRRRATPAMPIQRPTLRPPTLTRAEIEGRIKAEQDEGGS
jgi:enoyl-CoA hydratase